MKSLERHVASGSEYYNFSPSALAKEHLLHISCVGDFRYEAGYELHRTSFDGLLLEVILDGRVKIETGDEMLVARAGQVVLIDCSLPHRYSTENGWRALWVHLDGPAARGYMSLIHRQNGKVFATRHRHEVTNALQAVFDMFAAQQPVSETAIALLLTQALTALSEPAAPARDRYGLVDQAVTVINSLVGREPSVSELAKQVGLSEYHFIRVFREVMGVTPGQYIIGARMGHAKYLLKTTNLPVSEIGIMSGFSQKVCFRQHSAGRRG